MEQCLQQDHCELYCNCKEAIFSEAVHTEERRQTNEWITDGMFGVFNTLYCKVAGAVTDNTIIRKKMWRILKKKFLKIFFH